MICTSGDAKEPKTLGNIAASSSMVASSRNKSELIKNLVKTNNNNAVHGYIRNKKDNRIKAAVQADDIEGKDTPVLSCK